MPQAVANVEHGGEVTTAAAGGVAEDSFAAANVEAAAAAVAVSTAGDDPTGAAGAAPVLSNGQPLTRERDLDAERDAELYNEQLLDQMLGLDSTSGTPGVQLSPTPSRSKFKGSASTSSTGQAGSGGGGDFGDGLGSNDGGESRGSSADDVGGRGNSSRRAQSQVHLDQFRANVDGAFAALESLLADGQQRCDQDIATLRKRRKEHDATFHQQNLEESMAWAEVTKAREMRRIQTCLEKERERLVALESQFETNWEAVTSVLATGDRVAFHETCANHAEQELEWLNAQQRFLNERRKQVRGSQHQHVNHEMNRNLSSSYGR
mmetsp:Transcript_32757/g.86609  ORF Transcript_32757/g.86609 Transcript_32757/m.86609 type:complete len:321 (+) Transcript_32757:484-1446(+)